jgi:hypothetical protein
LAGADFVTARGVRFSYALDGGYIVAGNVQRRVPESAFKRAFGQWPAGRPSLLRGVFAPSTVWAVLADPRVLGLER